MCLDGLNTLATPLHLRRRSQPWDINYESPKFGKIYRPAYMIPVE